jgi:hypothetical protein
MKKPDSADTKLISDLVPDPENRREHNERNLGMVREALHEVGTARSIVIDENDIILAGNGVTEAARLAGITNVRIIESQGDELIAIRRRGLTPEQKRKLSIFDNRTSELSTWSNEQLAADRDAGLELRPFWTEAEEAMLLGQAVAPEWSGMPEFEQDDVTAWRSIKVHFACQEDFDAFAALVGQPLGPHSKFMWYPRAERESVRDMRVANEQP